MTGPRPVLDSGLGAGQGIWEVATEPILKVGTRASLEDGRVFYYARSSGPGIAAGHLVQSEMIDDQNEDLDVVNSRLGDESVTVTFGTDTADANEYAGGYLCVIDVIGEGITYEIKSHAAVTSGGERDVVLVDPIYVAFSGGTTVSIVKNPWQDVVVASITTDITINAGVPQVAVPVGSTTAQYFWCQTWGVACVRTGAAMIAGAPVTKSDSLTGSSGYIAGQKPDLIGINLGASTRTELNPVFLKISQ
jgi:hypothetical protein